MLFPSSRNGPVGGSTAASSKASAGEALELAFPAGVQTGDVTRGGAEDTSGDVAPCSAAEDASAGAAPDGPRFGMPFGTWRAGDVRLNASGRSRSG